ncbi:MAG: inositol monophosphatase family protein [Chloroflexota bacterium]
MTDGVRQQALLQAVCEVARVAGDVALQYWRKNLSIEVKSDGSPVTAADRDAESTARNWIEIHFPQDGIVGEEFGITRPDAVRRWFIDPIDGTKTFVRGVPLWGTLVAVAKGEEVLAGAAYFPSLAEIVAAAGGEGCWWNDQRCFVSPQARLAQATVLTTDTMFRDFPKQRVGWGRLTDASALSRSWGDCYGYLLVATGRAEVMVDPLLSPWDAAALQPIVVEAGGVFTDWYGTATAFGGSAVATNAGVAGDVRALLAESRE